MGTGNDLDIRVKTGTLEILSVGGRRPRRRRRLVRRRRRRRRRPGARPHTRTHTHTTGPSVSPSLSVRTRARFAKRRTLSLSLSLSREKSPRRFERGSSSSVVRRRRHVSQTTRSQSARRQVEENPFEETPLVSVESDSRKRVREAVFLANGGRLYKKARAPRSRSLPFKRLSQRYVPPKGAFPKRGFSQRDVPL